MNFERPRHVFSRHFTFTDSWIPLEGNAKKAARVGWSSAEKGEAQKIPIKLDAPKAYKNGGAADCLELEINKRIKKSANALFAHFEQFL